MFCNYFHCCYIQSETKPPSTGAVSPVTFGVRSGMATGTRSARQMEEQMGTLLTTLQEQGQRQEQLAREQANQFSLKLKQLAEEQREWQAEFS